MARSRTHRSHADERFRRVESSERLLRQIVDETGDLVFVKDVAGRYITANPASARVAGHPPDEILGRTDEEVFPPDVARALREVDLRIMASGVGETYDESFEVAGEIRHFSTAKTPFREADGTVVGIIGISRDITDRKRAERELEEAVRARQDFLSVAGHELKTPLTSLLLSARLVDQALTRPRAVGAAAGEGAAPSVLDLDGRLAERWRSLRRQIGRLDALVDQLLDVSRLAAGKLALDLERLDLGEVVRDVAARFAGPGQARIALDLAPAGDPPGDLHGCWDRLRLEQVVTNLLSNAIKYGEGRPIDVSARSSGGEAVVTVRDRGVGIAPDALARIFDRFERATSVHNYGGLGLGLWIVRQLVEAMGGRVGVESALGAGSTFTVRLPRRPRG